MRILSIVSIVLVIFLTCNSSFAKENNTSKTFKLMNQKKWQSATKMASKTGDLALKKIVQARQFLDSKHKANSFEKIVGFLEENPKWPQAYLLRVRAENYIDSSTNKKPLVKWFKNHKPITGNGAKYYAYAASDLIKEKNTLTPIIKAGWHYGNFTRAEQKSYYNKFKKYLSESDHVKKIDNHLWATEITAAKNSLHFVNMGHKKSFNAQIALIRTRKNARRLFHKVPKKYYTSGLIYRYLSSRKHDLPKSSELVKLSRIASKDKDCADKFWKVQSYIAREFIEKKKYRDAYKVSSSHFTTSAGNKSEAEFLSGWLALRYLNKPNLALKHFRSFNRIVRTPISKSRGIYWLARSHEDARDDDKAARLYELAATKYTYTFYGQMAAAELGRKKMVLPKDIKLVSTEKALEYAKKNHVVRAAQLVSKYGSNALSQIYIKAAMNQASTTEEVLSVATALKGSSNVHHMAWASKYALQKHVLIKNHAYPSPYEISHLPTESPLTYSIIRQESVFDHKAVSSAQAMGLMQLIKSTACQTARNVAVRCHVSKLTSDAKYNMKLGSSHLKELIDSYDGSYILSIAAYNAGSHNVKKWLKTYSDPRKMKNHREVLDWLERIPFYETRNYVQRVLENLQIYRTILDKKSGFGLKKDLMRK